MKFVLVTVIGLYIILDVHAQQSGKFRLCLTKQKAETSLDEGPDSLEELYEIFHKIPSTIKISGRIPFNISSEVISGIGYLEDIEISDFLNFTICGFSGKESGLLNMTLNSLKIKAGGYNITGDVGDLIDIYGNGAFEINLEKLSIKVSKLRKEIFHLTCFDMNIEVMLGKMTANFTNLMGGDDFLEPMLNRVIGDMGPDVVDYSFESVHDYVQKFLDEYIHAKVILFMMNEVKGIIGKCINFSPPKTYDSMDDRD